MLLGKSNLQSSSQYFPNLGYIGKSRLKVPNYLFKSMDNSSLAQATGYHHCEELTRYLLSKTTKEHFEKSQALTQFLKKREMTFSKRTASGQYKIFTVPCTTTPLTLPKSLFDILEKSSQVLVTSLRMILQDLYGSESPQSSRFAKSLPDSLRTLYVETVKASPNYFPQLHSPVMKDYPFFDVVGLDLVLSEDLPNSLSGVLSADKLTDLTKIDLPAMTHLPFKLLEINAGSPSGASNNLHILEGLSKVDPELLTKIGKVMPNDHFDVLHQTYKSLGETWTKRADGVQIVLPPGGESGAAPEIHQLAAYGGLIYADAQSLYQDGEGYVRLRTFTHSDPIVNAIYSRVNADSALFDAKQGIFLRDPETGENFYVTDPYEISEDTGEEIKPKPMLDQDGNPIALESAYAIPGAIKAILSKKLYVGGLNRVLDNKIILSLLCEYGPKIFDADLKKLGIKPEETLPLTPPETLPSEAESIEIISKMPEEWVIKAPNLSGGNGIHILKTLPRSKRNEVIQEARANPEQFAYQRIVKIGRIPIATKSKSGATRYANIAADIRMWSFFGAHSNTKALPKLTHNALVRTAPQEKGPMSSIVNTSKGGGYSPMLVVDDIGHPQAVDVKTLITKREPRKLQCDLPLFAGAQLIQAARIAAHLRNSLSTGAVDTYELYALSKQLKKQCREILSYLHPSNMEPVNDLIDLVEKKVQKSKLASFEKERMRLRAKLGTQLIAAHDYLSVEFFSHLDTLHFLNATDLKPYLCDEERIEDLATIHELKRIVGRRAFYRRSVRQLFTTLKQLAKQSFPIVPLKSPLTRNYLLLIQNFISLAHSHLKEQTVTEGFVQYFSNKNSGQDYSMSLSPHNLRVWLDSDKPIDGIRVASEWEHRSAIKLSESQWIDSETKQAFAEWSNIVSESKSLNSEKKRTEFIALERLKHLAKYTWLKSIQDRIFDEAVQTTPESIIEFLSVLPHAKYNFESFCRSLGHDQKAIVECSSTEKDALIDEFNSHSGKIILLSKEQRHLLDLNSDGRFAGECYAQKKELHGLFSDSNVIIWVAKEIHPLFAAYTVGHEIIHYYQIQDEMKTEREAIVTSNDSPSGDHHTTEASHFINRFGNFFTHANIAIDPSEIKFQEQRTPVVGFVDFLVLAKSRTATWVHALFEAHQLGPNAWNEKVKELGGTLAYSVDSGVSSQVKSLREILPALENGRNLAFLSQLGLELPKHFSSSITSSVLPAANQKEQDFYTQIIQDCVLSANLSGPQARLIGSFQHPGVRFQNAQVHNGELVLKAPLLSIVPGHGYNQTQQQQQ